MIFFRRPLPVILTLLTVLIFATCFSQAMAQASTQKKASPKHANGEQKYIVVFNEQPLAAVRRQLTAQQSIPASSKLNPQEKSLSANSLTSHKSTLTRAAQKRKNSRDNFRKFLNKKTQPSQIKAEYSQLVNGVGIVSKLSMAELKQSSEVKAVFAVNTYKAKLAAALPIISAEQSWQLLGGQTQAGNGVKIAIIDSGIIPEHPMFADDGIEPIANFNPENPDYCQSQESSFCNNKLILARYYPTQDYNFSANNEFDSPYASYSHGVHVAGIATGRQVTTPSGDTFSGVAPGAYLMIYKALWGNEGISTDIELIQALEDAYQDGADIINNSWGGEVGAHPISTLYQELFTELEANGVVLVTAAGNEAEYGESTINCPACVEAGIAVAASSTTKTSGHLLSFNGEHVNSTPGDNYIPGQAISGQALLAPDDNLDGCSAFSSGYFQDKVAVVYRGTCFFEDKAEQTKNAGATAMIVINNQAGTNISMVMAGANLTSTFISAADGERLINALNSSAITDVVMAETASTSYSAAAKDYIAPFSSLGPNGDQSFLKPDLAAPGQAILSAATLAASDADNDLYSELSGTSMAAPLVAGAAALLKQNAPQLSAKQIKSLLINASAGDIKSYLNNIATPFETGAGRLNTEAALLLSAYAKTPNMVLSDCGVSCSKTNELIALSLPQHSTQQLEQQAAQQIWQGEITFNDAAVAASLSPNQISLTSESPNQPFTVSVNLPYNSVQNWYFGEILWRNDSGQTIRQAVVAQANNKNSELLTVNMFDSSNQTKQVNITSTNTTNQTSVDYEINLVGAAKFAPTNIDTNSAAELENILWQEQSLRFSSQLPVAKISSSQASLPFDLDVSEQSNYQRVPCSDGCDEFTYPISFNFQHLSKPYSTITVSDNGLAFAGHQYIEQGELSTNLPLPNSQTPNSIIAPFWLDFDLEDNSNPLDSGGGEILYYFHQHQDKDYLVIQWHKAKIWLDDNLGFGTDYWGISDKNNQYSFQIILEQDSDNIWFNYLDIPENPSYFSVGLENETGTFGIQLMYDGDNSNDDGATDIFSGQSIAFNYQHAGELSIDVKTIPTNINDFAIADKVSTQANTPILVNVLSNDLSATGNAILLAKVANKSVASPLYFDQINGQQSQLLTESLTIVSAPSSGIAEISSAGIISYQPDHNFIGYDSIEYQVANNSGETSTAFVTITVGEPLAVDIIAPDTISDYSTISLVAQVSNTSSAINYQWNIPDDFQADNLNQQTLTVTVPSYLAATLRTVSLTVSDDKAQENTVTNSFSFFVDAVNNPPENVTITGAKQLSYNETATFTAHADDFDSELNYSWKLSSGLVLESVNANTVTVQVSDKNLSQVTVSVAVSDGEYSVSSSHVIDTNVVASSSGGSISYWWALIVILIGYREKLNSTRKLLIYSLKPNA